MTTKQKAEADNRAEWWKRTQWALDAVYSADRKRGTIGLKVLKVLGDSDLDGAGELAVLEAASERPIDQAAQTRGARATAHAAPSRDEPEEAFDDDARALQIAAAQLREVTDARLGKLTPEWVKALAQEQPPGHTA